MEQPDGYAAPGKEDHIWRLKKGLYGLVQARRIWNEELNAHMESVEFVAAQKDSMIYVKNPGGQRTLWWTVSGSTNSSG